MRKYGSGPAGAQPIGLGHASVRLPERILENVADHNRLSAIHGRAAGSGLTDSSSSWRDSRTSLSSSTMNTVGTSCVLITTRLNQKESPVKTSHGSLCRRRSSIGLTTPDRLYRMMQCGGHANPRG